VNSKRQICALLPVKETGEAKQRLAGVLSAPKRRQLALAMVTDVLEALSAASRLSGILVITVDPEVVAIAGRYRARVSKLEARAGHSAAVAAGARQLAAEGFDMLALPGDIPLLQAEDITAVLEAHGSAPAFTIVPARDEWGSNAVLCSPPNAVALRFGENSYYPHLEAARARGIEPSVLYLPRIALDIDTPSDLALFLETPSRSRTRALLVSWRCEFTEGPLAAIAGGMVSRQKR
jgi:2-phospho-L-lactate/phosphoenolpyruvate guanylyltransferase